MLQARLGAAGHVSPDGNFSWLEVECLGACCNAPMVQINQDYYEDLTPEILGTLMDDLAAGRPVKVGSQTGRVSSEPQGGADTLTDPTLFDGSRVGAWRKRFEETGKAEGRAEARAEDEAAATRAARRAEPEARPARCRPRRRAHRHRRAGPARRRRRDAGQGRATAPTRPSAAAPPPSTAPPARATRTCSTAGQARRRGRAAAGERAQAPGDAVAEPRRPGREARSPPTAAHGVSRPAEGREPEQKRRRGRQAPRRAGRRARRPTGRPDPDQGIGPATAALNGSASTISTRSRLDRDEITWVGTYLAFPGRIDRENWVGQAKALSAPAQ